ncbi:MAG TPA: hypothetical protein VF192_14755 [Longimicrobiales bacterium]
MMGRTALAALSLLLGTALTAHSQEPALEGTIARFAKSWSRGDAGGIASFVAAAGVSLDLEGGRAGPLGSRQAAAALRRVFEDYETVSLRSGMIRIVGGTPQRAFGELDWVVRARGTTDTERRVVFVALVREERGWRVTHIRLLR